MRGPGARRWMAVLFGMLFLVAAAADDGLLDQARAQAEGGDLDAAMRSVDEFLAAQPSDEGGRFLRGVLLVETGRNDEAIAEFNALVEDREPAVDVYEALAMTVPGIVARESAMKGGEQLAVPSFDRA